MQTVKLLIFFNLVFIPILVLSFFGAAYIVRGQLQESAEQQVLENSRVMMETAKASRSYTTKQIAPLLDHEQSKIDKANNNVFQILDKIFGTANGFGWKLNEVIGAQIVSVPAKLADASADKALKTILLWLAGMLGFVLLAAKFIVPLCSSRPSSR